MRISSLSLKLIDHFVKGKGSEDGSDVGSGVEEDYDVDEEDDNDYAENYFDNGEADDLDDLVAGDDVGGGGGTFGAVVH